LEEKSPEPPFDEGFVVLLYAPLEDNFGLPEVRLQRRLDVMLEQFTAQPNCSIPQASDSHNDMDAAYNFFANPRIVPADIVTTCLPETLGRLGDCQRVLAIQDTSDFNFSSRHTVADLGYTSGSSVRGLLLHSTLAVRPDGLPLGVLTQQIWTRDPATKGHTKQRRKRDAQDKESYRWLDHAEAARLALPAGITVVHVADREGDIYDWLAADRPAHAHLLVRVAQAHRVVVHGPDGARGKLAEVVRAQPPLGTHTVEVPRADDRPARQAVLTLRRAAVQVLPPRHAKKRAQLSPVPVWVIEAHEESPPAGQKPLCWRLVTTEPVASLEEVIRALQEYVIRWRIERFHFVLKQGCQVEQLQLETVERLENALAVYSQVAVRLLRLTYLGRVEPERAVEEEFTADEVAVLDHSRQKQDKRAGARVRTLAEALRVIGRLGGHQGRKGDGPPGAKVLWRGLRTFHALVLGFQMGRSHQGDQPQPDGSQTDPPPSLIYPEG
jgi:hypothetical protein